MTVTLKNTSKVVTLIVDGKEVPARIWEGLTDKGIQCHAYITRIAVANELDSSEFDADLKEQIVPSTPIQEIPLRMII